VAADSELDPSLSWHARVALDHRVLDLDSAADCIDNAAKFDQRSVTSPLHHPTIMYGDRRVDEVAA
jgi:hypothetical protein